MLHTCHWYEGLSMNMFALLTPFFLHTVTTMEKGLTSMYSFNYYIEFMGVRYPAVCPMESVLTKFKTKQIQLAS